MIERIDHHDRAYAGRIHRVFQASYTVEAKLLGAVDFPPLKRTVEDFLAASSEFFAYYDNGYEAAIVEIKSDSRSTHIQSLVVHPDYFRKGIGSKLMDFVLDHFDSKTYRVETGVDNLPAIRLYKKMGFTKTKEWDTPIGIRKVELKKLKG